MKIFTLLIASLFLTVHTGSAQGRIDSLDQALQVTSSKAEQAALHNQLAWEWKDQNPDQALTHASTGIQIAEKTGETKILADLNKTTGVIYWYTADYDMASQNLLLALDAYRSISDQEGIANVLNNLGLVSQASGNHAQAVHYLEQSVLIREQIGDRKGVANSCNNIGIMHFMAGEYQPALERHLKAMVIWDELKDYQGRAFSLMNIGRIHLELYSLEEAMTAFSSAFETHLVNGNLRGQADAHSNIADVYLRQKKYSKALGQFFRSLTIREQLQDKTGIRECLSKIGEVEFEQGKIKEAISYHLRALSMARITDDHQAIVLQYNLLGKTYLVHKDPQTALTYLIPCISLAQELGTKHELSKAFQLTAAAYKAMGQHEQAVRYLEYFVAQQDSVLNEHIVKQLIEMEAKYKTSQQQQEINALQQQSTIERLQFGRLLAFAAALLLGGFSVVLLNRYRYKARTAQILATQKQEIESRNMALAISNADLEQFAYAVSHDLKQPLRTIGAFTSLIARRYEPSFDEDGKQFINYVIGGVTHMNNLLSDILTYSQVGGKDQVETLDLNMAVSAATQNLEHFIHSHNASVEVDVLPIVMGHYAGMVRLFQNLIHNGIKFHGEAPPVIRITYTPLANDHLIAVTDNGLGIEKPYLKKIFALFQRLHTQAEYPGTGIGLAICQKVAWQHGGSIWAESQPEQGSTFLIKLPKDHFAWEKEMS